MSYSHCSISSCGGAVAGYSQYCARHVRANSRHGHPEQSSVTVRELGPFVRAVSERMTNNATNPAWSILTQRWARLQEAAAGVLMVRDSGRAYVRHEVQAAEQLQALAQAVLPADVIRGALALYLLQDHNPRRFKSDRAFDFQLVRRVRALTKTSAGTYWSQRTRAKRWVYRDLPPRAVQVMAIGLREAFGLAGLQFASLERQRIDAPRLERLAGALAALR